jgi:hypothetical protein
MNNVPGMVTVAQVRPQKTSLRGKADGAKTYRILKSVVGSFKLVSVLLTEGIILEIWQYPC